jgi:hypothetical protein
VTYQASHSERVGPNGVGNIQLCAALFV